MTGFYLDPTGDDPLGTYGAQAGMEKPGNNHCGHRIYDPGTGRWSTPDPVYSPSSNLFNYCGSLPLQHTDPNGTILPFLAGAAAAALIIGGALLLGGCGGSGAPALGVVPTYTGAHPSPGLHTVFAGAGPAMEGVFTWVISPYHPITPWGATARFTFVPFGGCACETIAFVQVARGERDGAWSHPSPKNPGENNDAYWQTVSTSSGYWVDHVEGEKKPYYNLRKGPLQMHGASEWISDIPFGTKGMCYNSATQLPENATMEDMPGVTGMSSKGGYFKQEFSTCAICVDTGEVLGCLTWGVYMNGSGTSLYPPSYSLWAPKVFGEAVGLWNSLMTDNDMIVKDGTSPVMQGTSWKVP